MKIIINAVHAFISSIKVDIELGKLTKELDRKGLSLIDPRRVRVNKDKDALEGYAITKAGIQRIRLMGYTQRSNSGYAYCNEIKAVLLRHGYTIEKVYATPTESVVGKSVKAYTVTPRTMGE